jgi:hypothetical protein
MARLLVRVACLLLHLTPHGGLSYAALHYLGVEGVTRLPCVPASSRPLDLLKGVT